MDSSITRITLPNGLLILLKEIHTAPLITQWVWYRVGSRDETQGKTGLSHWVEHMQFKGTDRFPPGELDRAISRLGGTWNAFTFFDWTTYLETLPAADFELALMLEADRMKGSLFNPEEVESERTVIISERQGNENEPYFQLGEAVQMAAFQRHPYRNTVIGGMDDLHQISRDDLFQYYQKYYNPQNAVLALAGDFETAPMLEKIRSYYADLPGGPAVQRSILEELPQAEERRVTVQGPGETTFLEVAYKAPQASHPDFWPFLVLDSLLSGPSNFNMFGGGISNKTSRLYHALIEGEIAAGFGGGMMATLDPYLYSISSTLRPDRTVGQALEAIGEEIGKLQSAPPKIEELLRAEKQVRALFAYGSESISNQGFWMGFSEILADYNWFARYLDRIQEVTPEDVQRVAQKYLVDERRTVGVYEPTGEPADLAGGEE